ncbi:condensation domain-containing protein [Streptomyces olivochromogenes]|uniref:condensation domain-containing protein n=1 Tax=Streptomyces olivochromogenes TaxID=1963 RepID=UPI001F34B55F|nr:condensation domain-containing protein [Streptomyces olivochromogenes]MCF3131546.1 NAD-dependent epimerase/dehydratase family protein [Streptomyces olivochromogenes]
MATDTSADRGRQEELLRRARARASARTTPAAAPATTTAPASGPAPLSHAQRRMWLMDRLGHAGASYSVPFATRLRGPLDLTALTTALTRLVGRHEILRTRYGQRDGEPYQETMDAPATVTVPVVDADEPSAAALLTDEARRAFDLSAGEALHALVLRHGEQDHTVLLTFHHIAIDGGSLDTVTRELTALYTAAVQGTEPALPAAPPQYADFARREHEGAGRTEAGLRHREARLTGATAPRLPHPEGTTAVTGSKPAGTHTVALAERVPEALRALGGEHRATVFTVALAASFAALHRLTGDEDLVIGVASTHRQGAAMRDLVGLCVNTLPVRVNLTGDPAFTTLVERVRDALLEAQRCRHVPFDLILERLGAAARGTDGTALVRVTADVLGEPATLQLPGTVSEYVEVGAEDAKFDLTFGLVDAGDPAAVVQYARTALDDATAAVLGAGYAALLEAVAVEPGLRLSQLPDIAPVGHDGLSDRSGQDGEDGREVRSATPDHDNTPAGQRAEAALLSHPRVVDATVSELPGGLLLAYAVLRDSVGPTPYELRAHLRTVLAPGAVPAAVTLLDAMPRRADGAIDKDRLPGLPAPSALNGPRAETVTEGFTALLGRTPAPDDDFFDLGGHSLVAVQLAERLRSALRLPLTGLDVLQARTPRALTTLLDTRAHEQAAKSARLHEQAAKSSRVSGTRRTTRPGTVLVTGGTGGVGAFVLRELAAQGRPVLALARPESAHLVAGDGVEVVEGDLADPAALREAVAGADAVIHAACTFTRPEVDLAAMEAMIEGWRRGPFVFVSSVDAYGHPADHRVTEASASQEPLSAYGRGKLDCEALLLRAAGTEGRGGASAVRSPIVWGAHDRLRDQLRWGSTGLLYQAAHAGRPIELPRPGTAGHPWYGAAWVHAAALARAVTSCLDAPVHGVANAVSGHVSWQELASDLTTLLGSASTAQETDRVHQDLDHRWHYDSHRLSVPLRAQPGEDRYSVLAAMIKGGTEDDAS